MIYFVQSEKQGPIKIGFTENPKSRMRSLQVSHPYELLLLAIADGDKEVEKRIHEKFAHIRIRTEWFEDTEELLDFVRLSNGSNLFEYFGLTLTEIDHKEMMLNSITSFYNNGNTQNEAWVHAWNSLYKKMCAKLGYSTSRMRLILNDCKSNHDEWIHSIYGDNIRNPEFFYQPGVYVRRSEINEVQTYL